LKYEPDSKRSLRQKVQNKWIKPLHVLPNSS